jgi:hypothetical protein
MSLGIQGPKTGVPGCLTKLFKPNLRIPSMRLHEDSQRSRNNCLKGTTL